MPIKRKTPSAAPALAKKVSRTFSLEIREEDLKFSPLMLRNEMESRKRAAAPHDVAGESEATDVNVDSLTASPVSTEDDGKGVNANLESSEQKSANNVESPPMEVEVKDKVLVLPREVKGRDPLHGPGIVMKISEDGQTLDIKFILGGRDRKVPLKSVTEYDPTGEKALIAEATRASLGRNGEAKESNSNDLSDTADATSLSGPSVNVLRSNTIEPSAYVRRSYRCNGKQQLTSSRVTKLLACLWKSDPNDKSVEVLRLKNHIDADSNKQVLLEVLDALEANTVVQALYIQNMEEGMDDEVLQRLTEVLRVNGRIWALNVGENFQISRAGWEQFAEDLAHTHVTHLYAGSETTVYGALKVHMRDVIRSNRVKHSLHNDPTNIGVIAQIGQMWWNPKNAKCLHSHLPAEDQSTARVDPLIGRKIAALQGKHVRLGRIVKFNEKHHVHLVAWEPKGNSDPTTLDTEGGEWLDLESEDGLLLSSEMGWARRKDILAEESVGANDGAKKRRRSGRGGAGALSVVEDPSTAMHSACKKVWKSFKRLPACLPFIALSKRKASRADDAPIDLMLINAKLSKREYTTAADFVDDVSKFFAYEAKQDHSEARMPLSKWAIELLEVFIKEMKPVVDTYSDVKSSATMSPSQHAVKQEGKDANLYEPVQLFYPYSQSVDKNEDELSKRRIRCLFMSSPLKWVDLSNKSIRAWKTKPKHGELEKSLLEVCDSENCLFNYSKNMLCNDKTTA